MIPLKLHLTNFLSYAGMPEPLDFTDVRLACLSGPNGHGKSALLDAITWALWGKARGCEGGQDQERLIRDGASSMSVEFIFSLDGHVCRVARSRFLTKTKIYKSDLAFNVRAADDSWTDLSGEGLQDTQRRIIERLRMEYETFVTSAFILQGRADTFTTLDPRQRKDVLAKILGLEIYERLADRARDHKKQAQSDADAHARTLERLEHDLEEREDLERRKAEAEQALARATAERLQAEAALGSAQQRVSELKALEATASETEKRKEEAARALAHEQAGIERLRARAEELEVAARVGDMVRATAATLGRLEKDEARLEEARARHDQLGAEAASLEGRLREARSRLDAERDSHERAIARLEKELAAEEEARALLERARDEIAVLENATAEREALLARRAEIRERQGGLEAERQARDAERGETKEKLALLEQTGAACPLCGQALTATHRKQVKASFTARIRDLASGDRTGAKESKAQTTELAAVDAQGVVLKRALDRRETIAGQAAALGQRLERLKAAWDELGAERRAAAEIAARLTAEDFAAPERDKLARVREELSSTGFDAATYRELKAGLEAARAAERAVAAAGQAEAALEACMREAAGAAERSARSKMMLTSAERDLAAMGERLVVLPALVEELAGAERARARAQSVVDEAGRGLATTTHALEVLDREAVAAAEAKAAKTAATRTAGLYDKLAKAFGRDGIPARIIGNAIPELRIEANRLLGLLTDGQLSLSIDPVRETKSKSLKETLEVTVYDAAGGKRNYEMYSGGERLRIDFALRVALSRLLATRAGARLETLVIDEGFGSQDAEGRMRLLEAVMRVRSEFATVLVITHIDDLKEHFPVRLEVRKDPQAGSRVTVL